MARLEPGSLVDHFKVVRLLGRGGMGEVHLARDTRLGRKVALKMIHADRLGGHLLWDLGVFHVKYCQLLREVWTRVPLQWVEGLPKRCPVPPGHRCAGR